MSIKELYLGEVLDFFNGKAPVPSEGGKYRIYGSNGPIGMSKEYNHNEAIILGRVGAYCGSVEICQDRFWASDNTIVAKPKKGYDIRYVYYRLLATPLRNYAGGAAQPLLTHSILRRVKVRVYTQSHQQKRIADILSAYDDLIENNRRRIALLERAARLLYKEWFVHLRFPGHEHVKIIDGIPEGWEKGKVSDFGKVITGKTPSTKDESNYGGNIPFVKTPDMHGKIVVVKTEQTLSERGANSQPNKFIPKGSVMVSCIGTVGVVSIASVLCQTNQQINSVVFNNSTARYYGFFALSDLKPQLEGMGGGSTMGNVNKTKFSSLPVLIPEKKYYRLLMKLLAQYFHR